MQCRLEKEKKLFWEGMSFSEAQGRNETRSQMNERAYALMIDFCRWQWPDQMNECGATLRTRWGVKRRHEGMVA